MRWLSKTFPVLIAATAVAGTTRAASFECPKASTDVQKYICANMRVSQLDSYVDRVYQANAELLSPSARKELAAGQQSWREFWPRRCADAGGKLVNGSTAVLDCVVSQHQDRLRTLQMQRRVADLLIYPQSSYALLPEQAPAPAPPTTSTGDQATEHWHGHPAAIAVVYRVDVAGAAPQRRKLAKAVDGWLATQPYKVDPALAPVLADSADRHLRRTVAVDSVPDVISTATSAYAFEHEAANAEGAPTYAHFLVSQLRPLRATDVFKGNAWQDGLASGIDNSLKTQYGADYRAPASAVMKELVTDPRNWDMTPETLSVQFHPDQVGGTQIGSPSVEIPWASIKDWLNPAFAAGLALQP